MNKLLAGLAVFMVLTLGAWTWLKTTIIGHDFRRQLTMEDRRAEVTGANPLPAAPFKIILRQPDRNCLHITEAAFDGDNIVGTVKNKCNVMIDFGKVYYRAMTPSGVGIRGGQEFIESWSELPPGDLSEFTITMRPDPRIATVELRSNR